ncbi:phosphoribosylglycinamide formyltransferase [Clostridium sp. D2Q-11]|uniref:Phosphoribosylglycinamide formyltransferase n=1 Tax=Anaeromonas frigoriresistens TaxID=2683708 RepID=A0A942UXR5_9FIRM|nr:phosphoribosylglycinamide formyltransferase [Anaeromonas frigoriresistens]MBS4538901.1 phosphoribosylglycinamide formyltransferase [Anaeromonas frigoriresistens]
MAGIKIAVFISGRGSNLEAILDSINREEIKGEVALVISDRKDAKGLERSKERSIPSVYIGKSNYSDNESRVDKILEVLELKEIDLIVLAGYMSIVDTSIVRKYKNKIINIHPSLIPSFSGKGYYGSFVHKAVLDYGVKITGATVHFVDEDTDTGPVIIQEAVKVFDEDTVDSLSKRVLGIEHEILPKAIKLFAENKLVIEGRIVKRRD